MAFELQIRLSGLCVFVKHRDKTRTKVILINARRSRRDDPRLGANPKQPDGDTHKVEFHAGYLRFNLGGLVPSLESKDFDDGPDYEGVHRVDMEDITFPQIVPAAQTDNCVVPDIGIIDPDLVPKPGIFAANPAAEGVLGRVDLNGGEFTGSGKVMWEFDHVHNARLPKPYSDNFTGLVIWKRTVEADHLDVEIRKFGAKKATMLRLHPVDGIVELKIANLCSLNPLEWDELNMFMTTEDLDFKWHYRVLQNSKSPGGRVRSLPIPRAVKGPLSGNDDCHPSKIESSF